VRRLARSVAWKLRVLGPSSTAAMQLQLDYNSTEMKLNSNAISTSSTNTTLFQQFNSQCQEVQVKVLCSHIGIQEMLTKRNANSGLILT
jgi:hypothetical protein